MKKLFLSMILLALPLLVSAYDCLVDGIYYNLNSEEKTAEVTYEKYDANINPFYFSYYYGSVTIPEKFTYNGVEYSVTSIGTSAFWTCMSLTSVTIPNSVTTIGESAFRYCSGLFSVTIPNSVTTIGDDAFEGCTSLTSVNIPNSVTTIGNYAFSRCSGLTSVTIPNSVTTIESSAFSRCSSLISVTIPNSLTSIGRYVFDYCTSLTSVTIPNSVTTIGDGAFNGCSSLTSVTIPNSVISIGSSTFVGCSGLTSVTIPNSVTSIGSNAFSNCTGLTSFTIPNSVTSIGYSAFSNCTGLTSVTIPNSVTTIEGGSFYCCSGLISIDIPNSVTTIGTSAFRGCSSLVSVTIPNSVTTIGNRVFEGCSSLTSVTIPNSVISIGNNVFLESSGLTSVISEIDNPCSINENCFSEDVFNNTPLYVPKGTKDKYKSTDYWSKFQNIVEGNPLEHTLAYLLDGNTYTSYVLKEGDEITPEEAPTKEGYTFSGWSEIPETMPANDVTVTGTFTANKYKLTYMVDGEEYKASEVDYGTAITAEAVPTKEGYTFSGWSEIPSTMPAEDVTVTGTFTVNKYTITYMVDDAVLMTEEVAYGSAIAPPKSQKDGFDILWSSHPTTMPAYDLTIYGAYTTGINALTNEEDDRQVFTPDGKRVETPKKGLNIIRMSDGTVKKVVVK